MAAPVQPLPRFDRVNQCVWWGERRVELSANAFRLLEHLVSRPHQLVSKSELLDAVWPDSYVVDAVLSVTVSQLREAFDDDAKRPRFIETVYGRGYRWIGALAGEVSSGEPAPAAAPAVERGAAPGADSVGAAGTLVGRDDAIAELDTALSRAAAGRRQIVFVTGEPGIGKTAVSDHLAAVAAARGATVARGQCIDAYGMGESYMPLLEALQQVVHGSDAALGVLRAQAPTWLLQLPGLLAANEYDELRRALASSTGARMVRELQQAIEALAADRTIVLVLEDLHWSDPATVSALAGLAMRREAAKLLVIGTYRPVDAIAELHPIVQLEQELAARRQCVEIALDGFAAESVAAYLATRYGSHALPAEVAQRLHVQTTGNPLFLQNAIEDLEQRGWLRCVDGSWQCTVDPARLDDAVPETTRAMIDARLARLPAPSASLLEAASVVGPTFASQTLAAAVGRAPADVELDCSALARAERFVKEVEPTHWPDGTGGAQYSFRHALYQQELYRRITGARRQALHRAIAERLERGFAVSPHEIAGALALHYELGGDFERAATQHLFAAQVARSRYAFEQAAAQFRHGLDLLRRVPPGPARDAREIDLQSELITCIFSLDGPGSSEIEEIATRIDTLTKDGETTAPVLNALFGLIGVCITRGDLGRAEEICARVVARAPETGWGPFQADVARGLTGFVRHRRGDLTGAVSYLTIGAALPIIGASGMMEPGIACASDLGFTLLLQGELRRGLETLHDADARADATGHPPTIVFSSSNVLRVAQLLGDRALVERVAVKLGDLGERLGSPRISAYHLMCTGWLQMDAGRAEGVELYRAGIEALASSSHLVYAPYSMHEAAAGLLRLGRLDEARAALDEGEVLLDSTQARWCEPELHRLRGEIALASVAKKRPRTRAREQATVEAERCFRRAIEVAQAQGGRWFELLGWFSLARCHAPAGKPGDEPTRRLRELHATIDDGSGVAVLRDVRGFLSA